MTRPPEGLVLVTLRGLRALLVEQAKQRGPIPGEIPPDAADFYRRGVHDGLQCAIIDIDRMRTGELDKGASPDASDALDPLDERASIVKMLRNISRAAMSKEGLEITRETWKDIDRFDELPPHMAELFVRMTSEIASRCATSLADAIERGEHRKTGS